MIGQDGALGFGGRNVVHCAVVLVRLEYKKVQAHVNGSTTDMTTKQPSVIIEAVRSVLIVSAIYLSLWLSGFHDTSRRWILFTCLFGVWTAFLLGRSSISRVHRGSDLGNDFGEAQARQRQAASPGWAW